MDDEDLLGAAADRLEQLAARTTGGRWSLGGLLASRPEVVARLADGTTEHVAEARARSADWIVTLAPALAGPLAGWLRAAARTPVDPHALAVARLIAGQVGSTDRFTALYEAFNARDVDAVLAHLAPDVDWPDAWHGGRVIGIDAVRAYWRAPGGGVGPGGAPPPGGGVPPRPGGGGGAPGGRGPPGGGAF